MQRQVFLEGEEGKKKNGKWTKISKRGFAQKQTMSATQFTTSKSAVPPVSLGRPPLPVPRPSCVMSAEPTLFLAVELLAQTTPRKRRRASNANPEKSPPSPPPPRSVLVACRQTAGLGLSGDLLWAAGWGSTSIVCHGFPIFPRGRDQTRRPAVCSSDWRLGCELCDPLKIRRADRDRERALRRKEWTG